MPFSPALRTTKSPSTVGAPVKPHIGTFTPVSFSICRFQTIFPVAAWKQNKSPHRLNQKSLSPSKVALPVVPPSKNLSPKSAAYECFQISLPVTASKQKTVSFWSACPTTTAFPPLTTNDEKPSPTFAFHAIGGPCSIIQFCSHPVSFEMPLRSGPRHCGQSSAKFLVEARHAINARKTGEKKENALRFMNASVMGCGSGCKIQPQFKPTAALEPC